ncbi:DUF1492 domain-containing protein [Streptococcus sciuri]|uniref:DUF1492 domain-containing protein n=1 Tax=Streptococcus sciuri TaxID=2973939 RepID=A0ABT2F7F9_9STRE|nr:DUF1492 domain-containing protein [Streptococcus sciuri]MCS4488406.1 DUF1492 domain-containing protein [Streptococcus sciuri]
MSKAYTILNELKMLVPYIQSLEEERTQLLASLLTSPKLSTMKVTGGIKHKVDDTYMSILDIDEELAEALERKRELTRLLKQLPHEEGLVLRMAFINRYSEYEIRDRLRIGRNRYYRLKKGGIKRLDELLQGGTN